MSVAPARGCAFAVVRRVFEQGAFADRAMHAEGGGLRPRDRALATRIAYGTVQRRRTLDHLLDQLVSRPLAELEPRVLAALEIGLYQLVLMGGIREYAAVNDSVELVKPESPGGAKLVNATLRRAVRKGPELLAALDDLTPATAAILHSVPDWLAELWWRELGAERARRLLAAVNMPAESAIRLNPLRLDAGAGGAGARGADAGDGLGPEALLDLLPDGVRVVAAPAWDARPGLPELPEALVLDGAFDAFASELWARGQLMPQSRASIAVARVLAPEPGERVLDLCAAPGAKTTHLAALMGATGELVAVEVHPGRATSLGATCARMGAANVAIECVDARDLPKRAPFDRPFDRVLVDPPCSGLGTLQSRPDLRWQARRGQLEDLAAKQAAMLHAGATRLRPGGTLVYSVCTITQAEGEGQVTDFLDGHPQFACQASWQLTPEADGTDGFFIARLRRAPTAA